MPKGGLSHEHGVLLNDMEAHSTCGTCLMVDGRFLTVRRKKLEKAFSRIRVDVYNITRDLAAFEEKSTEKEKITEMEKRDVRTKACANKTVSGLYDNSKSR